MSTSGEPEPRSAAFSMGASSRILVKRHPVRGVGDPPPYIPSMIALNVALGRIAAAQVSASGR